PRECALILGDALELRGDDVDRLGDALQPRIEVGRRRLDRLHVLVVAARERARHHQAGDRRDGDGDDDDHWTAAGDAGREVIMAARLMELMPPLTSSRAPMFHAGIYSIIACAPAAPLVWRTSASSGIRQSMRTALSRYIRL